MADEYIKRNDALFPTLDLCVRCEAVRRNTRNCNTCVINDITQEIRDIPAADVVPVKHGRWDDNSVAFYRKCSECGCCVEWDKKPFLFGQGEYNFCPNCGVKMDGKEQDDNG